MKNISIIIPHYNSLELLKILISSIPEKEDIEILIIDDCSDKNEYTMVQEYCKSNSIVKIFQTPYNNGAGVCRNIGLSNASGKWILFADSDDFFVDNMYRKVSRYFDSTYDVVYFMPTSIFTDTGKIADRHRNYAKRLESYLNKQTKENELDVRYKFEVPWSKMIRRNLIIDNKINFEEVKASNDLMFSTKVGYYMTKFYVDTEVIYTVTRNSNSLTVNLSENIFDVRFKEKEKYFTFLNNKLNNDELKILNINFLHLIIKSKLYGINKTINTLKYLYKNDLPVIDKRLFNIKSLLSLIINKVVSFFKNYKYYKGIK